MCPGSATPLFPPIDPEDIPALQVPLSVLVNEDDVERGVSPAPAGPNVDVIPVRGQIRVAGGSIPVRGGEDDLPGVSPSSSSVALVPFPTERGTYRRREG